jgi:hypothetical protein
VANDVYHEYFKTLLRAVNRLNESLRVEHWSYCDRVIAPNANRPCTCGNDVIRAALSEVMEFRSKHEVE